MDKNEFVSGVLVENGIVTAVGDTAFVPGVKKIDLDGAFMMPSFIDAHSHFSQVAASFLQITLENDSSLEKKVREFIEKNSLLPGEWIQVNGYSGESLPDKVALDNLSPCNPLVVMHQSGHMGVFNEAAAAALGVKGGYYEETDFISLIRRVPQPSAEKMLLAYEKAQDLYISYGITTVQDGMVVKEVIPMYKMIENKLKVDIAAYAEIAAYNEFNENFPDICKGVKVFLDGSPQQKTAWMRTPYLGTSSYGCGTMSDTELEKAVLFCEKTGAQLIAHCNGDAAAQQYIDCLERHCLDRPVMIHAQFLDSDQFEGVKLAGIIPSFFVAHVYFFGDIHIKNIGFERASRISLCSEAIKHDVLFTFHQDSPVIKPDMLFTVQCAVRRRTKNGVKLGEGIDVFHALRAVTANVAYQYHSEQKLGTIEPGKKADFVIIDKDIASLPSEDISSAKILSVIKDGENIYNG